MLNNRTMNQIFIFISLSCALICDGQQGEDMSATGQPKDNGGANDCPADFWDKPTKDCLRIMDSVLDELVQGEWQKADIRINKTCVAYDGMTGCMDQLLETCADDKVAVNDLRRVVDRYKTYSLPCQDETLRHRQRLVDCFHQKIPDTRRCVREFDQSFQSHIMDDNFMDACKDVQAVMKCFHTTKMSILSLCKEEGAQEFNMDYILPIVEPTRNTVINRCPSLPSPYREYYRMPSQAQSLYLNTGLFLSGLILAFRSIK